uniref:Uncharacterized protein n=1 Tax=Peronospora matthiolae TaxID=2874970 RepID=A0AAV1UFT6_9STRA
METRVAGMADDVAAIRQYWGSEQEYSHNELFAIAQSQWEREHRNGGDAAREFVLQIVANRLEEQLLAWLLQSQVDDTIEDIQKLLTVCLHPYCAENGLELVEMMLDTLVTAAVVRAAACDCSAENRMRQIDEIRDEVEAKLPTTSRARDALRALANRVGNGDEVDIWTTFSDLPNVLEAGLFNSQSARALMDEAEQVILLQQAELEATRGSSGDRAGVEAGEGRLIASDMLWNLAKRSGRLVQSKADQSGVHRDCHALSNTTIDVVENMEELEAYLKAKPNKGQSCSSNCFPDLVSSDEDADPSAIGLLSGVHISSDKKEFVTDDVIERAVDELSAMENLDVISVQTSFLLSLQMRLRFHFLDRFESTNDELVRRIRSVFNRLTGKAPDSKHVASLTILAAFCPTQVVGQCILGARAGVLHQNLYVQVLRASPLLLEWIDGVSDGCETMFECELQQAVLDVCSGQNNFDRESQNLISFLQSVVEIPKRSSVQQKASVMTVSRLVDKVINPVCCRTSASAQIELNLYTLVQRLFQHFVTTNAFADSDHAVLQNSFQLVLGVFCTCDAIDLTLRVHVREKLLLLLKNIMELMPGAASIAMPEQLNTPLLPSLWTLLHLFYGDMVNHKFCNGWDDVVLVKAYMQAKSIDDSHAALPLHVRSVVSAVQVLLWELLWNSTLLIKPSPVFSNAETWSLMDAIAGFDLFEIDSGVCAIKGSLLIHHAVGNIVLECGGVVFEELLGRIIPHLLKYESNEPNAALKDSLQLPKWAIEKLFERSKGELHIPCQLVSTHFEMRYVATCWYLLCAARELVATTPALILQSLSNVLAAHDRAVSSSQRSLSGTLFCIQWLSFLASTVVELQLDRMPAWPTLRIQLELLLLRLLHHLEQLKGVSASEAQFSQGFVAAWLAYLPPRQFENVFGFVASRTTS